MTYFELQMLRTSVSNTIKRRQKNRVQDDLATLTLIEKMIHPSSFICDDEKQFFIPSLKKGEKFI